MAKSKSGKCKIVEEIPKEGLKEEQQEEKIEEAPPEIYYKCSCGHEDYLLDGEHVCAECGKAIGFVTQTTCNHCGKQLMITENVIICPVCNEDLATLEERLENSGIIPTDDPQKANEIAEREREKLKKENTSLISRQIEVETVISSKDGIEDLLKNSRKIYNKALDDLITEKETKKIKTLESNKNQTLKIINAALLVLGCIKEHELEKERIEQRIEQVEEKIKNTQLPLQL